jgi:LemA protein
MDDLLLDITIFIIAAAAAVWLAARAARSYNALNGLRHPLEESRSNAEIAVKQRNQLARQLTQLAERYGFIETTTFREIANNPTRHSFIVLGSQFPELKSDQAYLNVMNRLPEIQREIESRMEIYNSDVREYNQAITNFPNRLFAPWLGFRRAEYSTPSIASFLGPDVGRPQTPMRRRKSLDLNRGQGVIPVSRDR